MPYDPHPSDVALLTRRANAQDRRTPRAGSVEEAEALALIDSAREAEEQRARGKARRGNGTWGPRR